MAFFAVELSVELQEGEAAAECLQLLSAILALSPEASRSVQTLQIMVNDLRKPRRRTFSSRAKGDEPLDATLTILYAHDHERLLRRAAHDAKSRFVCCTNRMGSTMVPAVFDPAEAAGQRLDDVRCYYSRHTGPMKRRHVGVHRERLRGLVDVLGVKVPQVHAKFLLWDEDNVAVSTINWGSQVGRLEQPLDELGLHIEKPGLARELLGQFEDEISGGKVRS